MYIQGFNSAVCGKRTGGIGHTGVQRALQLHQLIQVTGTTIITMA